MDGQVIRIPFGKGREMHQHLRLYTIAEIAELFNCSERVVAIMIARHVAWIRKHGPAGSKRD